MVNSFLGDVIDSWKATIHQDPVPVPPVEKSQYRAYRFQLAACKSRINVRRSGALRGRRFRVPGPLRADPARHLGRPPKYKSLISKMRNTFITPSHCARRRSPCFLRINNSEGDATLLCSSRPEATRFYYLIASSAGIYWESWDSPRKRERSPVTAPLLSLQF